MTNRSPQVMGAETDVGLKNFMVGTYRYMAMAMAFAAAVAYFGAQFLGANPQLISIIRSPFLILGIIIGIMFAFGSVGARVHKMSFAGMLTFMFAMAGVLGALCSLTVLFYPTMVVAKIFFMTVALFASLSLFGYTTRYNLMGVAKIAATVFMAFIAIMVLGMFVPSMALSGTAEIVITAIALVAVSVLVAFKTQFLKETYYGSRGDTALQNNLAVFGATSLLLSFYNMFQMLMSLFGSFGE